MEKTVLCYIEHDNKYLMLNRNKRANDLNSGKWLGVGGHIEENETPDEAMYREAKEETGLILNNITLRGKIDFINDSYHELMYLYTCNSFSGNLIECNEGTLEWINKDMILNLPIWEGDRVFLTKLLNNDSYFEIKLIYHNDKFIRSELI